ncbi:MAG: hypothetical protein GY774_16355 [Planctomycetes bacterium]|nr:hypothetical protein [Planctomycetota bacterium]
MYDLSEIIKMKQIAEKRFRDFCSIFDDFAKNTNLMPESKKLRELRLLIDGIKSPLNIIYEDLQ